MAKGCVVWWSNQRWNDRTMPLQLDASTPAPRARRIRARPSPASHQHRVVSCRVAGHGCRETHHISGAAVKMAEDKGVPLSSLSVADLASINPLFTDDVVAVWDFNRSAEMRDTEGGVSKRSVLEQVDKMKRYLKEEQH